MMSAPAFDLSLLLGAGAPPGTAPPGVGAQVPADFAAMLSAAPVGDAPAMDLVGRQEAAPPGKALPPVAPTPVAPDLGEADASLPDATDPPDDGVPSPADDTDAAPTIDPTVLAWLSPPIVQANVPPPATRFRLAGAAVTAAPPAQDVSGSSDTLQARLRPTAQTPLAAQTPVSAPAPEPEPVPVPPRPATTLAPLVVGNAQRVVMQAAVVPVLGKSPRAPSSAPAVPQASPDAVPTDAVIATTLRATRVAPDTNVAPPPTAPVAVAEPAPRPLAFAAPVLVGEDSRVDAGGDPLSISAPATPLAVAAAPAGIPATAPVQTGIDLRQAAGVERMIDHIEQLRDAAATASESTRSTRISLSPDSLGRVEVSVQRDGDAVRVHFTAAESGTRQLLAEARPQLTELAEARGVRIERATVGSDAGQADARGQQQQPGAAPAPPRAPARARAVVADDAVSDTRIA